MGGYMSPEEAEAQSPYRDPSQPSTAEAAAAVAGQQVGFRGSYGGPSGKAARDYYEMQLQQQQQQNNPNGNQPVHRPEETPAGYIGGTRAPNGDMIGGHPSEEQMAADRAAAGVKDHVDQYALMAVEGRPGWTDPTILGGIRGTSPSSRQDAVLGRMLEEKRQDAASTEGIQDDQYASMRLQQWGQNKIELGEAYHHFAMMLDVPVAANPFELTEDFAVEFLKGAPTKPSEYFSPVSGEFAKVLPGGQGVQQVSWDMAIANDRHEPQPAPVSFMKAVDVLGNSVGLYGPYSSLYGGKPDTRDPFDVVGQVQEERIAPSMNTFNGMTVVSIEIANHGMNPDAGKVSYTVQSTPNQQTVWDIASNSANGILNIFGFNLPTNQGFATQTITETQTRTVNPNNIISGMPAATWMYIGEDNRPTPVMDIKVGDPYLKNGEIFQDYVHSDLSKVLLTETRTYSITEPSIYDSFNARISGIIPKVPGDIQRSAQDNHIANFFVQGYETAAERPLDIVKNASLGVILIGGGELIGGAISSFATGTRFAGVVNAAGKITPWVLGGLYAENVAARSTKDFTDWSTAASGRLGGIMSTETVPMIAGGALYAYSPNLKLGIDYKYNLPSFNTMRNGIADFVFELRQKEAGFEKVGSRSGMSYYTEEPFVMQKELPDFTKATTARNPATEFRYNMLETNEPVQMLLPEIPASFGPKIISMEELMRPVFPREAPLWRKMTLENTRWVPESKESALNYIKDRYPGQEEIWGDYLTNTQKLDWSIENSVALRKQYEITEDYGIDQLFKEVAIEKGAIGKPVRINTFEEFNAIKSDYPTLYRGVRGEERVTQFFESPEPHASIGMSGSGIYTAKDFLAGPERNVAFSGYKTASDYGKNVIIMKILPGAKVATRSQISELLGEMNDKAPEDIMSDVYWNPGRVGLVNGYDAINTQGYEMLVLNKNKVAAIYDNTRWVPESKEVALNYIKNKYPRQGEIWNDYLTETQELHPEYQRELKEENPYVLKDLKYKEMEINTASILNDLFARSEARNAESPVTALAVASRPSISARNVATPQGIFEQGVMPEIFSLRSQKETTKAYWQTLSSLEESALAERTLGRTHSQKKESQNYPMPFVGFNDVPAPRNRADTMIMPYTDPFTDMTPEPKPEVKVIPMPDIFPKTEPKPQPEYKFEFPPIPPIIPPPNLPILFGGGVGFSGGRKEPQSGGRRYRKKTYENPVVDIPYLQDISKNFGKPIKLKNLKI